MAKSESELNDFVADATSNKYIAPSGKSYYDSELDDAEFLEDDRDLKSWGRTCRGREGLDFYTEVSVLKGSASGDLDATVADAVTNGRFDGHQPADLWTEVVPTTAQLAAIATMLGAVACAAIYSEDDIHYKILPYYTAPAAS